MSRQLSTQKQKIEFVAKSLGIRKMTSISTIIRSKSKQIKNNKQNIILPNFNIKNIEHRKTEIINPNEKMIKTNKNYVSHKERTKLCLTENGLPQKKQQNSNDNLIKIQIEILVNSIINKKIIEEHQKTAYLINKEVFSQLCLKLVNYRFQAKNIFDSSKMEFLNGDLDILLDLLKKKYHVTFKSPLNLQSKTTNINIVCSDESKQRWKSYHSELAMICQKINEKKTDMERSEEKFKYLSIQAQELYAKIKAKGRESHEYQSKIDSLKTEMEKIRLQSQQIKARLQKVAMQQKEILNFTLNQNKNKIVQMAGEDYKQIESEIYQYAVYLQSNELASSLTYEHLPIVCHTFEVQNEIRNINTIIIQNQTLSIDEKNKIMRNFVLQLSSRYKKKDEELQKMLVFKTQCIKNFVDKMKKWLNNWEYKQEYLKNLRIEFAQNDQKIVTSINELKNMKFNQLTQSQVTKKSQQILNMYLQIQMNHKMGNFFY